MPVPARGMITAIGRVSLRVMNSVTSVKYRADSGCFSSNAPMNGNAKSGPKAMMMPRMCTIR
jgi:hypothetical protein